MKANAPKRKVFQDALDLLAEDSVKDTPVAVNGIISIPVEEIHPFHDHPFRLYEGDRLEDMVQSIREHGVLNPVIVRKAARGYEMLAGHNRTNAAKIARLTEVPAIVKTDLSDEDAYSSVDKKVEAVFHPYLVRVEISDLNIRKKPGTDQKKAGKYTGAGCFTIVAEADGVGALKWGLLKAYEKERNGWISLDFVTRI